MRNTLLGGTYRNVLLLQASVVALFALLALFWRGEVAAWSALMGGVVIVAGNLVYAIVARPSKVTAKAGSEVLLRHVLAELAKVLFVLGLMLVAFSSGKFDAVWVLAAMGIALLGHVLSLFLFK
jgi:F0F1-type ATP synthase assembly protein I